jgi:hypothetical protein
MRQKITCPQSAHLEEIEYTTDGRILQTLRCTASPDTAVDCDRLCAKRLNARLASPYKSSRYTSDDIQPDDAPTAATFEETGLVED